MGRTGSITGQKPPMSLLVLAMALFYAYHHAEAQQYHKDFIK
jgi:hypothetical protein